VQTIEIDISGLRCDHCVRSVTAALRAVPGVVACQVDLATGRAIVEVGSTPVDLGQLRAAIRDAGYEVAAAPPAQLITLGLPVSGPAIPRQDPPAVVNQLRQQGHGVAMVGDGINDAAALASADLGIALAGGADIAIESADIVLSPPDLEKVAETIQLARLTLRTIRQNLVWAFLYNVILLPLAAGLALPLAGPRVLHWMPILSAGAMAMSSVSVVGNSLLLKYRRIS